MNARLKLFGTVILPVAAAALAYAYWRLDQSEAGICHLTGTKLSDEDIRANVIENLIRNQLNIIRHQDVEYIPNTLRFRVVDSISDEEIAEGVSSLNKGNDPFAKSDRFKTIEFTGDKYSPAIPKEPFVMLYYDTTRKSSHGRRILSSDIVKTEPTNLEMGKFKLSITQRMRGYGTNYYRVSMRSFRFTSHLGPMPGNETSRRLVPVAYEDPLGHGWVISSGSRQRVIAASNCGEVIEYKHQSGFTLPKWTTGE